MKNKIFSHLIFLIFLTVSNIQSASASIVDSSDNTFLTDTVSGLDWLDVTSSQGLSYSDVVAQLGTGGDFDGWRFATRDQFNTLLVNYTGLSVTELANPYGYIVSSSADITHGLVALMGDTDTNAQDSVQYTYGWIAPPTDGHISGNQGETAMIFDYHNFQNGDAYTSVGHVYGYTADYPGDGRHLLQSNSQTNLGAFLVRDSVSSSVPVPTTLALLALGLIGFGFTQKKDRH